MKSSSVSLSTLFNIFFRLWRSLDFHMNFKIRLSIFVKRAVGILMGIALNLWVSLGSTAVLMLFFQSMNTGYLYIYLDLELLSTLSSSFQCTSTAFPWLILLLILFSWCHCKWTSFPNFTFRLSIASIEKYLFLYKILYPATLLLVY